MEINGIKIRDIKDAQDILMALEIIKSGIENLSEFMNENYEDYNSISEDMSNSVSSQKELIESISYLQIKANEIIKNIDILNNNTKSINEDTISNLRKEFKEFDKQVENTIESAIDNIDLSIFKIQIERLFDNKIKSLESEVERLDDNNNNLEKLNTDINATFQNSKDDIANTIKSVKKNLNDTLNRLSYDFKDSIDNFNRLSKVVSWKVIIASVFGGVFIGALIMMFFGLKTAEKQYFINEQKAIDDYNQKKAALDSKYANASELEEVAREYGIKLMYLEKYKSIIIPEKSLKDKYDTKASYFVVRLKN